MEPKFLETEKQNTRFLNVFPQNTYQPRVDFSLKSSALMKEGVKGNEQKDLVPYIPRPKENIKVKYKPYVDDDEDIDDKNNKFEKASKYITTHTPPPLPPPRKLENQIEKNKLPILTPTPDLPSIKEQGSSAGYVPIPEGTIYQERTTNSTTYNTDVKKHYINIDTKFRNSPELYTSTNFRWKLFRPIKNCISIRVASVEIPNNFYTFSSAKKNVEFKARLTGSPSYTTLTLPDGNYTAADMESELQTLLQTVDSNFSVLISLISGKIKIENLISNFDILWPENPNNSTFNWGLGYNLGFTQKEYLNKSTLTAERFIDLVGDNYILLQIGDYEGIYHEVEKQGLISATAKIIITSDKYSILFDNGSNFITKEVLFPNPTNITSFNVRLIDSYNNDIDLLNTNYSFTLEIVEIVNSKLYSNYSDHLLQNTDTPR